MIGGERGRRSLKSSAFPGRSLGTRGEGGIMTHNANNNKKLFLSAVSSEFSAYRELLAKALRRPTLDVAEGEGFVVSDGTTLVKLDVYIRA